jgi:very-short-patch-repair endonuclease
VRQTPSHLDRRVVRARALRGTMTDAERKLWWHLRRLPIEKTHFGWQASVGPYYADFACHRHRLIIEVDGSQHDENRQSDADAEGTAFLQSPGYRVLRFWNNQVLQEIEGVMTVIYEALCEASRVAPPNPDPSPPRAARAGGGEQNPC